MLRITLILLTLALGSLARADVPGQDAPGYLAAREIWLKGEDATALPALSALAKEGNTAAQILLGRIQTKSHLHRHITGKMVRKDRIALMRMPGGLSGQSWLAAAASEAPLAQAYLDIRRPEAQADAARSLLDHGDTMAALTAIMRKVRSADIAAIAPLIHHPAIPAEYRALPLSYAIEYSTGISPPRPTLGQKLLWDNALARRLWEDAGYRADLTQTLKTLPDYAPIHRFCAANCPSSNDTCILATSIVAARSGSFSLQSPAEPLISTATYTQSLRFPQDLRRMAQDLQGWDRFAARLDRCAALALAPT